jgi:signal peptidase I
MAVAGKSSRAKNPLVETISIIVVAVALALAIQAFLVKPFRIPSESMFPTLANGQRVLVDRVTGRFSPPGRGDIVVFRPPASVDKPNSCGDLSNPPNRPCPEAVNTRAKNNFIKRVVGLPGDEFAVQDGRAYVNGKPLREPYARITADCRDAGSRSREQTPEERKQEPPDLCYLPEPIRIPPGHFFMMGDNRGDSTDSRAWGPVPEEWIVGQAFFTYWPPRRLGPL